MQSSKKENGTVETTSQNHCVADSSRTPKKNPVIAPQKPRVHSETAANALD
jgi:hypothetical protein